MRTLLAIAAALLVVTNVWAKPGDVDMGKAVYDQRCIWCHGVEGDGDSAATEWLNPPPRDFSSAQYKIKTTGFDDIVPNDEDIYRMIAKGMPGTAMPGWDDILSEQEIWDLTAYIKTFGGLEEETPSQQVDYGTPVPSSPESIARGQELFLDGERCSECHGEDGKGDSIKGLKDDNGERTWPRNLTKPWTFRGSNDSKDIYSRISVGIPGTQMPSFADPTSKKKLSTEERWHIANYVQSLAKIDEVVRAENTVVKADKLEGDLPAAVDDPRWQQTEASTFFLIPQMIGEERFFKPSNDTITVRALYSDNEIALLLEWDDRTRSIPGDEKAEKISDPEIAEDAVAIQLPIHIPDGMEKPYFGMGDAANTVNIWHWASGTTEKPESVALLNSRGFGEIERREPAQVRIQATGRYEKGTWRVLMKRPLLTSPADQDIQFLEGEFIPIAFAAWDGSNSETGSRHTLTTWYWLLLKPASGNKPLITALLMAFLIAGLLFWWARGASSPKERSQDGNG